MGRHAMDSLTAYAESRSRLVQKAWFLIAASVLILLSHLVDVVEARGPNWPALGVRAVWAALLVASQNMALVARAARGQLQAARLAGRM